MSNYCQEFFYIITFFLTWKHQQIQNIFPIAIVFLSYNNSVRRFIYLPDKYEDTPNVKNRKNLQCGS